MRIGGVGGFIAGYALKKPRKIVAVIIGLFILAEWIAPIIAHLPFAGAFGLAFVFGFKMG